MEEKETIFDDMELTATEAAPLKRFLVSLIDWAVEVGLFVAFYFLMRNQSVSDLVSNQSWAFYFVIIIFMLAYRAVSIMGFGKTVGMMVCRLRYLNAKMQPLTTGEKWTAVFAVRTASIKYYENG
jgi:uncharacterized RDD family membrane protein YckC